jgi:hypothetical protein
MLASLGFEMVDRPFRLRLVADAYGLDEKDRPALMEHLDRSMQGGGAFVQRRVEAGDPNFVRMLEEMGGVERYERRRRWWEDRRSASSMPCRKRPSFGRTGKGEHPTLRPVRERMTDKA